MKKLILLSILTTLFGCTTISYLNPTSAKQDNKFLIHGPDNPKSKTRYEFIQSRSVEGNLTINDILIYEKEQFGTNIAIINIQMQSKVDYFLFLPVSQTTVYFYDLVKVIQE